MNAEIQAVVAARGLDAEITVPRGSTLAVLGPNGAGKSSLLAVAAGLLRPDRGRVVVGGRTLTSIGSGRRVQVPTHARGAALLGQDPLLFPHLNARDNVAFGPRSVGQSRAESRAMAGRLLDEVGVADLATRLPRELSGGQAQRVAVARALATEPQILLLDEPMAALDVEVTPALRQTLRRILSGRTTVLVTHDVLDALILAERTVVIDAGRVVEDGPTEEVLTRPRSAFAARLAGLNLVRGRWDGESVIGDDGVAIRGLAESGQLTPGDHAVATFRPSAVAVYRDGGQGSPRNRMRVRVTSLEPVGEVVRVRASALSADITPTSVAELDLAPGVEVVFSVKATEVSIYPVSGRNEGAPA